MKSMNCFTEEQLNKIASLIREIEKLSDVEKLFLYLQLPCGRVDGFEELVGSKASKFNGNGNKLTNNSDLFSKKPDQETTQTYTWILSHLEVDPNVSLPKQEVYDEYRAFCQTNSFEPLCVADFGKAMKHAFPCIKPRRLGQRGNSRYCYSGLRKKYKIQAPNLPDMIEPTFCMDNDCSQAYDQIIEGCQKHPEDCPILISLSGNAVGANGGATSSAHDSAIFNYDEVMNLKIDTSSSNHQHQGVMSSSASGSIASTANSSSSNSTSDHQQPQMFAPSTQLQQHQQQQQQPRCSTNGYNGVIQQPGSPDDDDYRHNYHDYTATLPSVSGQATSQPVQYCQTINTFAGHHPATTNSFFYHSSKAHEVAAATAAANNLTSATTTSSHHSYDIINHHHHQQQQQHHQNQNSNVQAHLAYMSNSHHFDSCASPFLSPASTPYPASVLNHSEIQDNLNYYQSINTNGASEAQDTFIRYSANS